MKYEYRYAVRDHLFVKHVVVGFVYEIAIDVNCKDKAVGIW